MNDDLTLLASAYLDGDVTPEERARVEADPEATAEVERLRRLRAILGDIEPPAISMRERHLAAALDAWDRVPVAERSGALRDQTPAGVDPATAAAASSVSAVSLDARRERTRGWLFAAAAGLVVVLGGGIVLNGLRTGTGDDDSTADAPAATEAPAATDAAADAAADEAFVIEERTVEESSELAGDVAAEAEPPAVLESQIPGEAEAPPPEEELVLLTNQADLAEFAAFARTATTTLPDSGSVDAPAEADDGEGGFAVPTCPGIDLVVGLARYNGVLVVVGIDDSRNLAIAHDVEDCTEIARAVLP